MIEVQRLLCIVLVLYAISTSFLVGSNLDQAQYPIFVVSWLDDKHSFLAGDIATINIKALGSFNSDVRLIPGIQNVEFTVTVNGERGNSSYISGVTSVFEPESISWKITFIPLMKGLFSVIIDDDHFRTSDSSLHFNVEAGKIYSSACVSSWMNGVDEFVAGSKATVLILPKDAFGNNISATGPEQNLPTFLVSAVNETGALATILDIKNKGWNEFGYIVIDFVPCTAGKLILLIEAENHTLNGNTLSFIVKSGPMDVTNCLAKWNHETNFLLIFSNLEIFIHQKDLYGNLVSGFYDFDAQVIQKKTNLSIPIADFTFQEVEPGIQLLSFSLSEPGEFMLSIFDREKRIISNMPYDYTVFVGYCHGLNSIVNGSGLSSATSGQMANIFVYLQDLYHNPAPVEREMLHLHIIRKIDSSRIPAIVVPMQQTTGIGSGSSGSSPALSPTPMNTTVNNAKFEASDFNVTYVAEKAGSYEIWVFCGNIPLNGGRPYEMEVTPGPVDVSLSLVTDFDAKVMVSAKNEVIVNLSDSFSNPIMLQEMKLTLEMRQGNASTFMIWSFVDKQDGSYVGYYLTKEIGSIGICAMFERKHLTPCPFNVTVFNEEYFPKAQDDIVSVWEDESIAFDALSNDYHGHGDPTLMILSLPLHGSILQYGQLFRYTPYKRFFGEDSFSYSISDTNGTVSSAMVFVSILCTPPQFVLLPIILQATEDNISPEFCGFTGFEITYSNITERISVIVSTQYGSILLYPMSLLFFQTLENELSTFKGQREGKDLVLVGHVAAINHALQSIQYLGDDNFYGNDVLNISTFNSFGVREALIPILVEPINDPPFIQAPEYIILEREKFGHDSNIIGKKDDRRVLEIGDPDHVCYDGSFLVSLSMEVNVGIIMTKLPLELINTTERVLNHKYQWHPVLNYVAISNHFVVKGKGVRFRGTIEDCNKALQQLIYHGSENGAVLTLSVNDMGNYGCYPDCTEKVSVPLLQKLWST